MHSFRRLSSSTPIQPGGPLPVLDHNEIKALAARGGLGMHEHARRHTHTHTHAHTHTTRHAPSTPPLDTAEI